MQPDETLEKKGIKKKMMDFDYCEEYLYPTKYYYGSVKKSKFSFS